MNTIKVTSSTERGYVQVRISRALVRECTMCKHVNDNNMCYITYRLPSIILFTETELTYIKIHTHMYCREQCSNTSKIIKLKAIINVIPIIMNN